jgi:hypothetical protein
MASRSNRRQAAICGLLQSLCEIIAQQGGKEPAYMPLHDDAIQACQQTVVILWTEPNGRLTLKDIDKIDKAWDKFREMTFLAGPFDARHALSLIICLIVDRLALIQNESKQRAFEKMLHCAENLLAYFDPNWDYADCEGYSAAQIFEMLEL